MRPFGKSQPVTRVEDRRFLTGAGRYVDDIAPESALHAHVFRSPVAHAEIARLDVSAAREAPGVALVLTAEDLASAGLDDTMAYSVVKNRDGTDGAAPVRPLLARGRVRFTGEPVAMVVAETRQEALDAAELIELEYEELPAIVEPAAGGEAIHPEAPGNVAFDWAMGDEAATGAAFAAAAHTVRLEVADNRVICNAMEPRGAYAEWEGDPAAGGRVHLCCNGQGVWDQRDQLARVLKIDPARVRVTNPDVGGGFGMKSFCYPEYFLIAHAAGVLRRPVRWFADRTESMLSDSAGRDLVSTAEMAFDADLRLTGYRVDNLCNLGAYNSEFAQNIQSALFAKVLTGPYDVQAAHLRCRGVYTNTTYVDAYRGAGRPEAIYVLERVMDHAARALGVDPWELRRRNFITAFPYRTATGELYDVGDFARVLGRVRAAADADGFETRRKDGGRARPAPGAGALLLHRVDPGRSQRGRQGRVPRGRHRVALRRHAVQRPGARDGLRPVPERPHRHPRGGDPHRPGGLGPHRAGRRHRRLALGDDARHRDARHRRRDGGGVRRLSGGRARRPGQLRRPTLARGGLQRGADHAGGRGTGPRPRPHRSAGTHERRAKLPGRSYPNGAHVAEVEIDPETGHLEVVRYTVTDDFGNLVNPMLAEGQVHGGVAQGIGQAVHERTVYDADGQLLTATFMDYAMPRAADVPMIAFHSEPVPSTANPLGIKGCGEAGTVGALAAVANAVQDAVWDMGVREVQMPFTPLRLWEMLSVRAAAE